MREKQSELGVASLVLGIIGMLTACISIGVFPSLVGLGLGIAGCCSRNRAKGTAVAGLVCSIIGVLASAVFIFVMQLVPYMNKAEQANSAIETSVGQTTSSDAVQTTSSNAKGAEVTASENPQQTEPIETAKPEPTVEILFRDIPWGTSYTEVDKTLSQFEMWNLSGDGYKTYSVDEVLLGDYKGINFECSDINIIANTYSGEVDVAGYKTSETELYFAYVPVDGVLTKTEDDSSLYGARYVFEAQNLDEMYADLTRKLTSLYGAPSDVKKQGDKYTYTYWYGANDTELVLKSTNWNDETGVFKDEIVIAYAWRKGDELLQNASDILKQEAIDKEAAVYGNDTTDGL